MQERRSWRALVGYCVARASRNGPIDDGSKTKGPAHRIFHVKFAYPFSIDIVNKSGELTGLARFADGAYSFCWFFIGGLLRAPRAMMAINSFRLLHALC